MRQGDTHHEHSEAKPAATSPREARNARRRLDRRDPDRLAHPAHGGRPGTHDHHRADGDHRVHDVHDRGADDHRVDHHDTAEAPAVEPDDEGPIAALVVPVPGAGQSVITVKVGGTRSGPSTVLPQAGVTLQLFDDSTTTTPTADVSPNTCVSDIDGDCNWIVSDTGTGGANRDNRFWVRQIAPAGPNTYSSTQLNAGNNPWPATNYQFQTCVQLRGGQTCSSTATGVNGFMLSTTTDAAVFTASGGIWQTSRVNPTLTARCGLRVALILDVSGSVAPDIPELRTAATTFVSTLVGTPSSVGLFTFASNGPANTTNNQNRPLTSVSTLAGAGTVNTWINGVTAQTGNTQFTNWDRALNQVTESAQTYDVALIVTDGNPTAYGVPPTQTDGRTRFREVENGIFSANGLKAKGSVPGSSPSASETAWAEAD